MQFNKGKCTYTEVLNMPNRLFHGLYVRLINRLSTDEGQKQIAQEEMSEAIEEEVNP